MGPIIPEFFSFLRAMFPDVSSEMWLFFFLIIMLAGEWQEWERSPLQSSQLAFCTILALTLRTRNQFRPSSTSQVHSFVYLRTSKITTRRICGSSEPNLGQDSILIQSKYVSPPHSRRGILHAILDAVILTPTYATCLTDLKYSPNWCKWT